MSTRTILAKNLLTTTLAMSQNPAQNQPDGANVISVSDRLYIAIFVNISLKNVNLTKENHLSEMSSSNQNSNSKVIRCERYTA